MCFDFGFGPFRWVCCSGSPSDLDKTDQIAIDVLQRLAKNCDPMIQQQMLDNIQWITEASEDFGSRLSIEEIRSIRASYYCYLKLEKNH